MVRRFLRATIFGGAAFFLLYTAILVLAPWVEEKVAARDYPFVSTLAGAILRDDTGNPLRFEREEDAQAYAQTYLCLEPADSRCSAASRDRP